jgi:hypothetical protein
MPAPALRGGHGSATDVPDSRRAALFDLPDLKVKEFTFMPGAGGVIFAAAGRAE